MCNLYRMTKSRAEVADWFDAAEEAIGVNFAEEVYPGYPGLVVAAGRVRQMHWGFPLTMRGKSGQMLKPKPVNNTRSDKLGSLFWQSSFEARRCLIPVTAWAEAEGEKGHKTRTWLSVPDSEILACAGIWRGSDEWGDCYSMVLTDAAGMAAQVHTRMPVIIARRDYAVWTGGTASQARELCRPWDGMIVLDRTSDPWVGGGQARLL